MGRYSGKTCRLLFMMTLTFSFFLVELVTGYITHSLALVGDSYHMLSDVLALIVGFASVRISKKRSTKNTFGWARAEVVGALINSVFLVALCFTIFVEAMQRMFESKEIKNPDLLLIVGGVGLAINVVGLILFHQHGHSHGGGGHGHSHGASKEENEPMSEEAQSLPNGRVAIVGETSSDEESAGHEDQNTPEKKKKKKSLKPASQLNMKAVFLHVMGDALGSVIVIISAIVIKTVNADWKHKVDPAMSLVLVIIIMSTTIPLLKETAFILLQTVPTHIQVHDLRDRLLKKVKGVTAVHEFHIWQLAGNRIIASAHIRCQNLHEYMRIAEEVKEFFHDEGIHSTTIQPEFVEDTHMELYSNNCLLTCPEVCKTQCCCDSNQRYLIEQKGMVTETKVTIYQEGDLKNLDKTDSLMSSDTSFVTAPYEPVSTNDLVIIGHVATDVVTKATCESHANRAAQTVVNASCTETLKTEVKGDAPLTAIHETDETEVLHCVSSAKSDIAQHQQTHNAAAKRRRSSSISRTLAVLHIDHYQIAKETI